MMCQFLLRRIVRFIYFYVCSIYLCVALAILFYYFYVLVLPFRLKAFSGGPWMRCEIFARRAEHGTLWVLVAGTSFAVGPVRVCKYNVCPESETCGLYVQLDNHMLLTGSGAKKCVYLIGGL